MCGRVDLSIPATNTPMTLRRRADRILRGEILGQELGGRALGGSYCRHVQFWNRGSVTARARFRMVSGRRTGRWRGGLAGKVGGKSGGESGEAVSIKYIYTSRSQVLMGNSGSVTARGVLDQGRYGKAKC